MAVERIDPSRLAVVGGDESDIARFVESDFKIRQGLCPNGHGLMNPTNYGQECPTCHFFCNQKAENELQ